MPQRYVFTASFEGLKSNWRPETAYKYLEKSLYECSRPGRSIGVPEFLGRAIFFLFKDAVKIRDVIKSALISNFVYGVRGFYQQPGSMPQPYFYQCIHEGFPDLGLEEPAESHFRHGGQPGGFAQ